PLLPLGAPPRAGVPAPAVFLHAPVLRGVGSGFAVEHILDARMKRSPQRCSWATTELGIAYHDHEWGVPVHGDRTLFEFLILEGAQAGLSWETILKKRENYRRALDNFEPGKVAKYDERKIARL